jgi:phage protein D
MSETLFWSVTVTAAGVTYDLSRDLTSFTIEEEDRSPAMLTVQLSDPWTVFTHAFREGMDIAAELGTEDDHRKMFLGRIYHVDSALPQDGTPTLTIKAYDAAMKMGLQEHNRRFQDLPLSTIVTNVVQPHLDGAPITIDLLADPTFPGEGLRQCEETDLAFVRWLARRTQCAMGVDLVADKEQFVFKAQQKILQSAVDVVLHYNRCDVENRLLSFNAQVDVGDIAVPRTIAAMDPDTGDVIDPRVTTITEVGRVEDRLMEDNIAAFEEVHPDRATALRELISVAEGLDPTVRADLGEARRDAIPAFATPQQAADEAAQQQPSASIHGMEGTGTTVGNKDVHVRKPLDIEGGGRFSGTWMVSKATHAFDRQGYRTEFTCKR